MSTSAMVAASGARTRLALFIAAGVMAVLVLAASGLVGLVAMPALAALLIVVGVQAIKPARIRSVMGSGPLQTAIMAVTFVLTLLVPAQFAVLIGVGLAIILFVGQQSNRLRLRQLEFRAKGGCASRIRSAASRPGIRRRAPAVRKRLLRERGRRRRAAPRVDDDSRGSVVILRMRGIDEVGLTFVDVLDRYLTELEKQGSTLRVVVSSERVITHLKAGGLSSGSARTASTRAPSGSARRRGVLYADGHEWVRGTRTA